MYQIFFRAFCKGLADKAYVNTDWQAQPQPDSYDGGDLKGVENHLAYLEALWENCLYFNPIRLRGDELDGAMNYGLTKAMMDYLIAGTLDAAGMAGRLTRLYWRCTHDDEPDWQP